MCEVTWDGLDTGWKYGEWRAVDKSSERMLIVQVKGSSNTEDITLYALDLLLIEA